MMEMIDKNIKFIEKARKIHGDKYDYSKVNYINAKTKICIICPKHGEFWQRPDAHLSGQDCPLCKNSKLSITLRNTSEQFIKKANRVHKDKYIYAKTNYINNKTKVCIICPKHGEFWQTPSNHLQGKGCPKCNGGVHISQEEFIEKCKQIHNDNYDYSKVQYHDSCTKIRIICPIHGIFYQMPRAHLQGQGCPLCKHSKISFALTNTTKDFINKSQKIHGGKYDYSKVKYINNSTKVCIICPEHGEFWQTPSNHLQGKGCSKCSNCISKAENEIIELLKPLYCEHGNRQILNGKELDIYIPSLNIAIEYNGLYWHSEEFGKDKNYHLNKLEECNKRGIKLIQIFEDEWIDHKEICISKLKRLCGLTQDLIAVSRTDCKLQINDCDSVSLAFLNNYTLEEESPFTRAINAYFNDILIASMAFVDNADKTWSLTKIAMHSNYYCDGIEELLFKYFIDNFSPQKITAIADRRWIGDERSNNYTKLGFKIDKIIPPDYSCFNPHFANHKRIPKTKMPNYIDFSPIWNCGAIQYIYQKLS